MPSTIEAWIIYVTLAAMEETEKQARISAVNLDCLLHYARLLADFDSLSLFVVVTLSKSV